MTREEAIVQFETLIKEGLGETLLFEEDIEALHMGAEALRLVETIAKELQGSLAIAERERDKYPAGEGNRRRISLDRECQIYEALLLKLGRVS